MTTIRRPHHDEFELLPFYRKLYAATVLGRPGDPKEEPAKYTQTFSEHVLMTAQQEWVARINEVSHGTELYVRGQVPGAQELVMTDVSEEDLLEGDAALVADQEDLLSFFKNPGLMYYMPYPPVIALPINYIPSMTNMFIGPSSDVFYNTVCPFTLEGIPYFEDMHMEDGIFTAGVHYVYENAETILSRRHLRTGEDFRHLCCQRSAGEGLMMMRDILLDIRNEKAPEYAQSAYYGITYVTHCSVDVQYGRAVWDLLGMIAGIAPQHVGLPFAGYTTFVPLMSIMDVMISLPLEIMIPKMLSMLMGGEFYESLYNLTHADLFNEYIGQEMIPPTPSEFMNMYLFYGMDKYRFPPSFKQAKRVYGQEAKITADSEYPYPEGCAMAAEEANEIAQKLRKEHPEWLTGY